MKTVWWAAARYSEKTIVIYETVARGMVNRPVSLSPEAQARIDRFVEEVDERLASDEPTADVVSELLARIHGDGRVYERWQLGASLSLTGRLRLDAYDPRHVKADSWAEKDEAAFRESKPFRWLWTDFDASPLAREVAVAVPFRQTLANHLFAEAGDGATSAVAFWTGTATLPYGVHHPRIDWDGGVANLSRLYEHRDERLARLGVGRGGRDGPRRPRRRVGYQLLRYGEHVLER